MSTEPSSSEYIELTSDEMIEQVRKRMPLVPNAMALIQATLSVMTEDQLLQLLALSSTTIQVGIDMGLDHDLFMQLMEQGWEVMRKEEIEDACQEAHREAHSQ